MKFSLWTDYGALNSKPVFDAFAHSITNSGHTVVYNDSNADVDVIWSVLFHGRMAANKAIWDLAKQNRKSVVVLEVGGIKRGTTWKVGLNGINRDAYFGDYMGHDSSRSDLLKLKVKPWRTEGKYILIAGQHNKSLQWQEMPSISNWFLQTYDTIRKYTDRPIIFRPHPRCRLPHIERGLKHVYRQEPVKISGSYDDFDMGFNDIHATISWSSNPGIHSIIDGVPSFVGPSSLAYPVSNTDLSQIENPLMPDRTEWLNNYAYTEYTVEEIAQGIPLNRLTSKLI